MMLLRRPRPVLSVPFVGTRSIAPAVEALIGPRGLGGIGRAPTPRTLELVGLAVMEVLHSIVELSGKGRGLANASVVLWAEPALAIIVVRFAGPALPERLLTNWDRGEEPMLPEAAEGEGWGWLLVREALDAVGAARASGRNLLFLEKRL